MSTRKGGLRPQSTLDFRLMSLTYRFRDFIRSRMSILSEVGIKQDFHVLDYGCGPGSYIVPLAELVGNAGKVYALDINPIAIQSVQKIAAKRQLVNVHTILSDCETGLPPDSLDAVLLHDNLHDLSNSSEVLAELHRVLRPEGVLSVSDHHFGQDEIVSRITEEGLYKLSTRGRATHNFSKNKPQ